MPEARATVAGSETHLRAGEHWLGPVPDSEIVSVTVLLRRRSGAGGPSEQELLSGKYQAPNREAAEAAISANPADIAAVQSFAHNSGLTVASTDEGSRRIRLKGDAAQMNKAFGVQLRWAEDADGQRHISYEGSISVPEQLSGMIVAVLGLDLRVAARPH